MFDENGGTDYETSTIKTYLNTVYKETFGEKEQYIQEITLLDFDSEVVWVNESEGSRIDYNESGKEEGTLVYLYKNYRDTFFEIESIDASIYDWRYDQIQSHLLTKTVVFPNDDPDYLGILHSGVVYNFVKAYDLDGNFAGYEPFLASTTIDFPVRPVITISKKALD